MMGSKEQRCGLCLNFIGKEKVTKGNCISNLGPRSDVSRQSKPHTSDCFESSILLKEEVIYLLDAEPKTLDQLAEIFYITKYSPYSDNLDERQLSPKYLKLVGIVTDLQKENGKNGHIPAIVKTAVKHKENGKIEYILYLSKNEKELESQGKLRILDNTDLLNEERELTYKY